MAVLPLLCYLPETDRRKVVEKCGPGLHNEDFGEHVLLTGGDAEHHPSYNIQPSNSMTSISYISKCLFFVVCLYL